jgi:hypothetical protein
LIRQVSACLQWPSQLMTLGRISEIVILPPTTMGENLLNLRSRENRC